jgi:hypothetical protein
MCPTQQSRVTVVSNYWTVQVPFTHPDSQKALYSRTQIRDSLNRAGVEAGELVAATTRTQHKGNIADMLSSKR